MKDKIKGIICLAIAGVIALSIICKIVTEARLSDKDIPTGYTILCDGEGHYSFRNRIGIRWITKDSRKKAIRAAIRDFEDEKRLAAEPPEPLVEWHVCTMTNE